MNSLGIIAGKGDLPKMIIEECQKNNRDFIIFLIEGEGSNKDYLQYSHHIIHIGHISKLFSMLKQHNIKELVLAGGISKPSMSDVRVDAKGAILVSLILKAKLFGDDNLLTTIVNFFQKHGFRIIGAEEIINDLLAEKGVMTKAKPTKENLADIKIGQDAVSTMSSLDIGQSVIIQQKAILAVEAKEGTDKAIVRAGELKFQNGSKPILVKMKKKNQNTKVDMPAFGVDTINNLHDCGFAGVALQSGSCLVINKKEVIRLADQFGLFMIGI